jgi:hypothetical protein
MAFDICTYERHFGTLPAAMVARLSDETLESFLWHFSFDMIKRDEAREFGRWLLGVVCHEMKRRQSDGAIEPCSHEIPVLPIGELPAVLRLSNLITYDAPDSLARLFDHLHQHFIGQATQWINEQ